MSEAADVIIKIASLWASLTALAGAIIAVYKVYDNNRRQNKRQNEAIEATQEELRVICYALQGCLQGLIEQGCNGPCKDGLALLQKHLNKKAHDPNL